MPLRTRCRATWPHQFSDESKLSVKELVDPRPKRRGAPRRPEERLGRGLPCGLTCMWVDGVERQWRPPSELPHPDLLTKSWARQHLHPGGGRCDWLSSAEAKRLVAAMEQMRGPHEIAEPPVPPSRGSRFRPRAAGRSHHGMTWAVEGRDWPDGLAAAAYALGVIRWAQDATASVPSGFRVNECEERSEARSAPMDLVRLEATAARQTPRTTEIVRRWLGGGQRRGPGQQDCGLASAVVFEADGGSPSRCGDGGASAHEPLEPVRLLRAWAAVQDRTSPRQLAGRAAARRSPQRDASGGPGGPLTRRHGPSAWSRTRAMTTPSRASPPFSHRLRGCQGGASWIGPCTQGLHRQHSKGRQGEWQAAQGPILGWRELLRSAA